MRETKKRALRHNSLSMDVLKKMFFLHACWKSDLCAYAKTKIRAQNVSTNFNNLIQRGLIEYCCKAYNGWKSEMNEMIVQHHDRIAERKKKEQLITKHSFTSGRLLTTF